MDVNPYASPGEVEADGSARGRAWFWRALILAYLAVFCLLHAVTAYATVRMVIEKGRLTFMAIFGVAVPLAAAVGVGLYAAGFRPKSGVRFWQAVPFLVFAYACMSVRNTLGTEGTIALSVELMGVVAVHVLLYGPAIYMAYRLTGAQEY